MHRSQVEEKQHLSFTNPDQYVDQFLETCDKGLLNNAIDFTEGYLTSEQIIQLLVTVTSDQSASRENVLVNYYNAFPNVLSFSLTTIYQKHELSDDFSVTANILNVDHIIIVLLKSFWILYDAICDPEKIKYGEATTIKEEKSGDLKIDISPNQTNPLILLLIDIYKRYQKCKNEAEWKNDNLYIKLKSIVENIKLKSVAEKPNQEEKDSDESPVVLNRIKYILNSLSELVTESSKKNKIVQFFLKIVEKFKCRRESKAAPAQAPAANPQHPPVISSAEHKAHEHKDTPPPLVALATNTSSSTISSTSTGSSLPPTADTPPVVKVDEASPGSVKDISQLWAQRHGSSTTTNSPPPTVSSSRITPR
jgi:uncharacterized membrane protein